MKWSTMLIIFAVFIATDISEVKRLKKLYADTGDEKIALRLKIQKVLLTAVCIGAAFSLFGMIFLRSGQNSILL